MTTSFYTIADARTIDNRTTTITTLGKQLANQINSTQNKTVDKNLTNNKLRLFRLMGLCLAVAWTGMFIKGEPDPVNLAVLSMLTARWQNIGHKNGYLPNKNLEPMNNSNLFLFAMLYWGNSIGLSALMNKGRSVVFLLAMWHIWMELGYETGLFP